jgi:hypothetical protein
MIFLEMEQKNFIKKHFPHTIGTVLTATPNSIKIAPHGGNV